MTLHDRRRWRREMEDVDRRRTADLLAGYAQRLADSIPRFVNVLGDPLDAVDILACLDDTGLCLAVDSDGTAGDALGAVLFAVPDVDPLDEEPRIDTDWDVAAEDRDLVHHHEHPPPKGEP